MTTTHYITFGIALIFFAWAARKFYKIMYDETTEYEYFDTLNTGEDDSDQYTDPYQAVADSIGQQKADNKEIK